VCLQVAIVLAWRWKAPCFNVFVGFSRDEKASCMSAYLCLFET
jgi:hypothetical protein